MMSKRSDSDGEVKGFIPQKIRREFPIFSQKINGFPVTYLDSGASSQKPICVIDKINTVMSEHYANIHRGLYRFSQKTTVEYEKARAKIASFLNSETPESIVFTKNATEAINLVASSWGDINISEGDEILLTELEHHANIVPWYMLAEKKQAKIKYVPLLDGHENGLDISAFDNLITEKTKFVSLTHMSNVTGEILPVKEIIKKAHSVGAKVLIDGSQAAVHMDVDVQDLDCDFYVVTGHKLYGPTGIGALYGKPDLLNDMPPYQGGGEMIETVSFDKITYKNAPTKFEAGTPAFVEAIAFGEAIDFLTSTDRNSIRIYEDELAEYLCSELIDIDGVEIFGRNVQEKGAIVSFTVNNIHPHDIATVLDQMGICVRAGKHCAEPFMKARGVSSTIRASFAMYNDYEDVDKFIKGLNKAIELFS